MATPDEVRTAYTNLETAIQDYVRLTRNIDNMFVQDFVVIVASESMEPGYESMTFSNCINRSQMALYSIMGLIDAGKQYYRRMQTRNG